MLAKKLALLMTAALIWAPILAAQAEPLVFNTTPPINDLKGSLAAQVKFAQSQIVPAHVPEGDSQPYLIGRRKSLILVRPLMADGSTPMQVIARDKAGNRLGMLSLDPPEKLPKTAYYVHGIPDEPLDFTPPAEAASLINTQADLEKVGDPKDTLLRNRLRQNGLVELQLADFQWVANLHVPSGGAKLDGKLLRVTSRAELAATIHYSGRTVDISTGQTLLFKYVGGQWVREGELENQELTYAADTWSGVLPAEWIVPGLSLRIRQGNSTGDLTDLQIGAPTELLIHTIDVGMLVPPRGQFDFAKDPKAHREYFQTAPLSRLIVSQYAPLFLREVMLPDGTLLTDHDPSEGGWHEGTMRQRIGKELISLGIDNANYGINSTAGEGEDSHPYVAAQLAAHNTQGKYANGIVVHGGSGGGGIVTLESSLGNEFSHEVGHNYGLGHYMGGFNGSVHRPADQINSTWGWDADKNRFLPNFAPLKTGKDACLEDLCQSPFDGRTFGFDAMAGGFPLGGFNRFTLYTPYCAALIQKFLESKAVFDANSPTGFSKWNAETGKLEPYSHKIEAAGVFTAPVSDLSEARLASLLAEHEFVRIAMQDGNWVESAFVPAASPKNRGRTVIVAHDAGFDSILSINDQKVTVSTGFKKSYISDGKQWNEVPIERHMLERKPQAFGVPVTTLIGYYDPQGELTSYIYPALHGAYGFTYSDDRRRTVEKDCHLLVETKDGPLRFRLANHRFSPKVMNKFHINIPESSEPRSVSVVVGGQVVDKRRIAAVDEKLAFTVTGSSHAEGPAKPQ